jgi:aspartyl/glutamyl-tRNA(Asn/Gln) amidotransferase C subunit
MANRITKAELIALAASMHFALTDQELDAIYVESTHVLEDLANLEEINTKNVIPTDYCVAISHNTLRNDVPVSVTNPKDYLKNAKNIKNKYVVVK